MKQRKTITITVLSIYILYALLPLFYSVENAHAKGRQDLVFIDQQTVYRLSPEQNPQFCEEQSEHPDCAAQVLLKKKRAIVPSFKQLVAEGYSEYVRFSDFARLSGPLLSLSSLAIDSPNCPDGSYYYHSGISPPRFL